MQIGYVVLDEVQLLAARSLLLLLAVVVRARGQQTGFSGELLIVLLFLELLAAQVALIGRLVAKVGIVEGEPVLVAYPLHWLPVVLEAEPAGVLVVGGGTCCAGRAARIDLAAATVWCALYLSTPMFCLELLAALDEIYAQVIEAG